MSEKRIPEWHPIGSTEELENYMLIHKFSLSPKEKNNTAKRTYFKTIGSITCTYRAERQSGGQWWIILERVA